MATNTDCLLRVAKALDRFAVEFDDAMLANHIGPRLTCAEADALAAVLVAADRVGAAHKWVRAHAESDDKNDWHHELGQPDTAADVIIAYVEGLHE
jgi:hypothetical protein